MDFDTILFKHIGEFGRYQKYMFTLMLCVSITVSFQMFIHTFTGAEPDIICVKDRSANASDMLNTNLSLLENSSFHRLSISSFCTDELMVDASLQDNSNVYFAEDTINNNVSVKEQVSQNGYNHTEIHCRKYDSSRKGSTIVVEWQLICNRKWQGAFSQSVLMAGTLVGSSLLGSLTDRFGRKPMLVICTLGNAVFGLISAFSLNIWMYSFIRFFVGVTMAGQFNAAYILSLELVGPSYRALAAVLILLFHSFGMMLLAALSYLVVNWRILHAVISFPSFVLFVLYVIFVSESPRWLLAKQRTDEALIVMALMTKVNKTTIPSSVLEEHLYGSRNSKTLLSNTAAPTIKQKTTLQICDLIQSRVMLFRTAILTLLWMECSLTYYGLSLHSSSLGSNTHLLFFFIGLVEVPAILSYLIFNKCCDRREPVALSLVLSAVVLLATVFFTSESIHTIVLFILGKLFISMTFASIYPFATELYPTVLRTAGLGISSLGARGGSLIAPFITLLGDVNSSYPFLVFGACSLIGALSTYLLPEPKLYPLPQTVSDAEAMHLTAPSWMCLKGKKKVRESGATLHDLT